MNTRPLSALILSLSLLACTSAPKAPVPLPDHKPRIPINAPINGPTDANPDTSAR